MRTGPTGVTMKNKEKKRRGRERLGNIDKDGDGNYIVREKTPLFNWLSGM